MGSCPAPSPAGFGDDHLSSYLMKLHPEIHVLEGHHDGALRVGLQAGGGKSLTRRFHVCQEREKTVSSDRQETGPTMRPPQQCLQYRELPNSTHCCNGQHLYVCPSLLLSGHAMSELHTSVRGTALVQLREPSAEISPMKALGAAKNWGVCATAHLLKKIIFLQRLFVT